MNYETMAVAAKSAARDILRANLVLNLLSGKRDLEIKLKNVEKNIADHQKRLAIANFILAKGEETGDPRVEDYKKEAEETEKRVSTFIENANKEKENLNKLISDIDNDIKKVSEGEIKVNYGDMVEISQGLLEKRISSKFMEGDYDKENA